MRKQLLYLVLLVTGLYLSSCDVREPAVQPVSCFTASSTQIKPGETIDFSSDCSSDAKIFQWNFGNNNTSVAVNPSHRFDEIGEHVVKLIVVNKNLRDESEKTILVVEEVVPEPIASFIYEPTEPMVNEEVVFTNTSQNAESYAWDFGDGNSASAMNTSHIYSEPGSYTVTLSAMNGTVMDVESKIVNVSDGGIGPSADFTFLPATPITFEWVEFTNTSVNAETYLWSFGDGSETSSEKDPSHYYTASGDYVVSLTAFMGDESDVVSYTVKIFDELVEFDPMVYDCKPSGGWEDYFVDGFDEDVGDWSVKDDEGVSATIAGGYYTIELSGTESSWYFWTTGAEMPPSSMDYDIDVYLTVERDDSTYGAGLVWGLESENLDGNSFRVANYQSALWYTVGDSEYDWLLTASGWDNLYGKYLSQNLLSVRKYGDQFYVFLNEVLIVQHDYLSFGELFGFFVGMECRVKIDVIAISAMNHGTKKSFKPKVLEGNVNTGNGQGFAKSAVNNSVKQLK